MAQPCQPVRSLPLNRAVYPLGGCGSAAGAAAAAATRMVAAIRRRSAVAKVLDIGGSRVGTRGPGPRAILTAGAGVGQRLALLPSPLGGEGSNVASSLLHPIDPPLRVTHARSAPS